MATAISALGLPGNYFKAKSHPRGMNRNEVILCIRAREGGACFLGGRDKRGKRVKCTLKGTAPRGPRQNPADPCSDSGLDELPASKLEATGDGLDLCETLLEGGRWRHAAVVKKSLLASWQVLEFRQ